MSDAAQPGNQDQADAERDRAERRYVAALIALDAAAEPSHAVRASVTELAADVVRLNRTWNKHAPAPSDRSAAGPIKRAIAELARLLPWRRRRLHGEMLAAINRNAETTQALIDATQHFHSHVVWYAQTIWGAASAGGRGDYRPESAEAFQKAVTALGGDWLKVLESSDARDHRAQARMEALTKAYDEAREAASLAQQSIVSLSRTVESIAQQGVGAASAAAPAASRLAPPARDWTATTYLGFEDRFRGSREDIRERLSGYVPLFAGATRVLEIGCGRGELLELFREQQIGARGIDANEAMVDACTALGLAVTRADALEHLLDQPDGSLDGLVAIQVVEHLEPGYLLRLLETAGQKLAPGAPMVLETINAACWAAFFDSYLRDLTHARPLHPDTLKFLVQANGFSSVDVQFSSPIPDHEKLPSVRLPPGIDAKLVDLADAVNAHADRLNQRLFTFRDFAIVARK